jgi:hypothetical protein
MYADPEPTFSLELCRINLLNLINMVADDFEERGGAS